MCHPLLYIFCAGVSRREKREQQIFYGKKVSVLTADLSVLSTQQRQLSLMADQYSAATVTPVSNEPKVEVKTEPRVNGYGQVSVVSVPGLQQPQHQQHQQQLPYQPAPSTSSGPSAMTITQHQLQQESMEHKDAVMAQLQQQQHAQQQQQQQQQQPYWMSNREQQCCLVENGIRCVKAAGNASYSKRIQKTVAQRKLKLHMDNSVRN